MYKFVKKIINIFICHFLYRVKFINKHYEEELDKCIICPNHSNTLEPLWLFANTGDINIMAKAELFENKIMAPIYKYFGVFPIRRGKKDVKSIIHAINLFKNTDKRKLLIFPEGERVAKNVERGDVKVGPIYIAIKANVPIVPVYITKNARFFSRVEVVYGKPIYYDSDIKSDKDKISEESDRLLNIIYNLKLKENKAQSKLT